MLPAGDMPAGMARKQPKTSRDLRKSVARTGAEYRRAYARFSRRPSAKAVHLLRIATRRLLAMFELFTDDLPSGEVRRARKKAKGILSGLGPLRDVQVQLGLVPALAPDTRALDAFIRALKEEKKQLLLEGPGKIQRKTIPGAVRKALRDIERIAEKSPGEWLEHRLRSRTSAAFASVANLAGEIDPADPPTIHELRIAFKRFRYMAEFLAPVAPYVTPERIEEMRNFQALMGDVQDVSELLTKIARFQRARNTSERALLKPAVFEIRQELDARIQKLMRHLPELVMLWE